MPMLKAAAKSWGRSVATLLNTYQVDVATRLQPILSSLNMCSKHGLQISFNAFPNIPKISDPKDKSAGSLLYLRVKTMVSHSVSLKPIRWWSNRKAMAGIVWNQETCRSAVGSALPRFQVPAKTLNSTFSSFPHLGSENGSRNVDQGPLRPVKVEILAPWTIQVHSSYAQLNSMEFV